MSLDVTLAGTISDFTDGEQEYFKLRLAVITGVPPENIALFITGGSVNVQIVIFPTANSPVKNIYNALTISKVTDAALESGVEVEQVKSPTITANNKAATLQEVKDNKGGGGLSQTTIIIIAVVAGTILLLLVIVVTVCVAMKYGLIKKKGASTVVNTISVPVSVATISSTTTAPSASVVNPAIEMETKGDAEEKI